MRGTPLIGVLVTLAIAGCGSGEPGAVARKVNAPPDRLGLGRPATAAEIQAWNIDVMPDGTGLPAGRGTSAQGRTTYAQKCAACHGATGTEGPAWRLVGREPRQGFPFGRDPSLVVTIGNYWPYATTLYDYINRAMPLNAPGSLKPDEVYGMVAYLLWRNEIIAESTVIDARSLPQVVMPARNRFVVDNRKGGPEVR